MGYSYSEVTNHIVTDGNKYFLDSNIWIKILQPKINPSTKDKKYRIFFESILVNSKVKIVVPSLILAEVINRIIREVHLNKFFLNLQKNDPSLQISSDFYKNVFRPSPEYHIAYNLICDEFKNYHSSIDQISDQFGNEIRFKHMLSRPPQGLDFNDHYYYRLCKLNNFHLVTDDKDFWVENISVLTLNDTLLNNYSSII